MRFLNNRRKNIITMYVVFGFGTVTGFFNGNGKLLAGAISAIIAGALMYAFVIRPETNQTIIPKHAKKMEKRMVERMLERIRKGTNNDT